MPNGTDDERDLQPMLRGHGRRIYDVATATQETAAAILQALQPAEGDEPNPVAVALTEIVKGQAAQTAILSSLAAQLDRIEKSLRAPRR